MLKALRTSTFFTIILLSSQNATADIVPREMRCLGDMQAKELINCYDNLYSYSRYFTIFPYAPNWWRFCRRRFPISTKARSKCYQQGNPWYPSGLLTNKKL